MLKIGDFSRLARVTIKTLHHYEQVGLLRPAWIDRFTGYRYYSLQQLPRLNRILALKDLGFSLTEVASMVNQELSAGELRDLLTQKQSELETRLRAEQRRLEMVAVRLRQIELEGSSLQPAVLVKPVPAGQIASLRARVLSVEQLPRTSEQLFQRLAAWLTMQALGPARDWLTLHDNPEYLEGEIQIETGAWIELPPGRQLEASGDSSIRLRQLAAVPEMASLVSPRQTAEMAQAYGSLYGWVESNGYQVCGSVREVTLMDGGEAEERMVEIQFPVERNPRWSIYAVQKQTQKEPEMEVKIVDQPAVKLVGIRYQGKNANGEIGELWTRFNSRSNEIAHVTGDAAFGVCRMPAEMPEGEFEYIAALPVDKVDQVPEGMISFELPALKCAAYPHTGPVDSMMQSYDSFYNGWLPQSGMEPLEPGFDMEVYGPEFKFGSPDSVCYIYLPVK